MEDTTAPRDHRCHWAVNDDLLRRYHDVEWGIPQHDPRMLWEALMLEVFQAGLAWITILRKREGFREAFAGFVPEKVAQYGEADIGRLMANPGIVRSEAKIRAVLTGAQIYCGMAAQGESFADFCWSFTEGKVVRNPGREWIANSPLSETISKAMKRKGFKFVGPTIVYAWMQAVGIVNDHEDKCFRRWKV